MPDKAMHAADDSPENRSMSEMMVGLVMLLGCAVVASLGYAALINWKRGSDRAGCLLNIRNVQQAVRGYQGIRGKALGDPIDWSEIIGPSKFMKKPVCRAGGVYQFKDGHPAVGVLAMECSLCDTPEKHEPPSHADW